MAIESQCGPAANHPQSGHSRSEHHLRARPETVDAIAAVAPGGDDRVAILQPRIIDHEADIVDRVPDQRRHIAVLLAAEDAPVVEIEMVVAQVDLPDAVPAATNGILHLYPAEHPAAIGAERKSPTLNPS